MRRYAAVAAPHRNHTDTSTHCTEPIKHNASHPFRFFGIFIFCRPRFRRRSLINRKTIQRVNSKLQTYGRFGALVVRQFTISLLKFDLHTPFLAGLQPYNCDAAHFRHSAESQRRIEAYVWCVLSLKGDNQCGVRNRQKASCDNYCRYYPFKYLSAHSWCIFPTQRCMALGVVKLPVAQLKMRWMNAVACMREHSPFAWLHSAFMGIAFHVSCGERHTTSSQNNYLSENRTTPTFN